MDGHLAHQHVGRELGRQRGLSSEKQKMAETLVRETQPEANTAMEMLAISLIIGARAMSLVQGV